LSDEDPAGGPESPEQQEDKEPGTAAGAETPPTEATGLADALEVPDSNAAEAFHRRARLAEDRLAEVLAAYRALRTENEGYRDRVTKNIERRYDQRHERLLLKFIDILDNLDRALDAAEQTYAGEPLIEGLILVRTQLLQRLRDEGLERIPVLGLPYDPSVSEAVEMGPVDDPDHHNVVVKELLRGYRLNGRIARASRVVVGQYAEEVAAAPAPSATVEPGVSETAPAGGAAPEPAGSEPPATPPEAAPAVAPAEGEPSLEEIISRAEAQEALFPDAFEKEGGEKKEE
jgi:molecular chaperone GrpE